MAKYACFENNSEETYNEDELRKIWDTEIDQSNFSDYDSWVEEMVNLLILSLVEAVEEKEDSVLEEEKIKNFKTFAQEQQCEIDSICKGVKDETIN